MSENGSVKEILTQASKIDLDTVILLGVNEEGGSVMIHNADGDLDALALLKTFLATLEVSLLEELYARTKRSLN